MKLGIYRHFKGGHYLVLGVAADASDETRRVVVYVPLSVRPGPRMWVRDYTEFNGEVSPGIQRFTYVGGEVTCEE